jgi:Uma2 family endonuclease
MTTQRRATIEDLYRVSGDYKAELVNGEIVIMSASGFMPSRAAGAIYRSLDAYERRTGSGYAFGDSTGFVVHLPNRDSFSPDAAYYVGPMTGMKFLDGAPIFAVEVRSENDYGRAAERDMAAKRADYFAAGTLVVWDVDLLSADVVRKYDRELLDRPVIFRRGEVADAEPALPGWRMAVEDLFD